MDLENRKRQLREGDTELLRLALRRKQPLRAYKSEVINMLVTTAGEETRSKIVKKLRYQAAKKGWRRLWDGKNGKDYNLYRCELMQIPYSDPVYDSNSVLSDVSYQDALDSDDEKAEVEDATMDQEADDSDVSSDEDSENESSGASDDEDDDL